MTTLESQENYSLRWNNHQSHILESFDALLQQNSLVDVTLVCADYSLRAHKVVLSACSPFFEKVFNDTPCKHPVIVLKDYPRWVVQAIIDFMYRGEISVPQEHLTQLIQAGESLQIRGLIGAVPVTATESLLIENSVDKRECVSPMPRRKQARPRRRSEDIPQDLSNGPITTKSERDASLSCDEEEDIELHEIAKRVQQNENGTALDIDDGSEEEDEDEEENLENDEKENKPRAEPDVPENLCTKKSTTDSIGSSPVANDKNNNNNDANGSGNKKRSILPPHDFHERFILSLKDLRHLNRYRQCPPPGHPFNDLLSHLPISPPPSFQMQMSSSGERSSGGGGGESEPERKSRQRSIADDDMKIESDHSDAGTPPFHDQIDLTSHANFTHEKNLRENHQKIGQLIGHHGNSGMPSFHPPSFHQSAANMTGDGGSMRNSGGHIGHHQPQSPLPFPGMSSVSALNLTPPHMFGLDSPLGLFPPGMDPTKMYNPLLDLPEHHPAHHRQLHPDHPSFLKKKLQRPKGQHSAPRGGPPRSWTNAELTEALQHVWNKKMTTSQASRIFGIPYNSLLMYVRGKYGKSLKLEQLRKDCISGPPIEMLQMNPSGPSSGEKREKKDKEGGGGDENPNRNSEMGHGGPGHSSRRSASSDPELMNPLFSPFPGGFYPDFPGAGFPGLQLSMLNLLPPDARHSQLPMMPMVIDDDCKSDAGSIHSLDDSLPSTPLNLNHREKNGSELSTPLGISPQLAARQQMFQN